MTDTFFTIWQIITASCEALCAWFLFMRRLKTTPVRKYISFIYVPLMCATVLFSYRFDVPELVKYAAVLVLNIMISSTFFKGRFSMKLLWSLMHTYILSLCSSIAVMVMATSPEKLALIYSPGITSTLCWGAYMLLCIAFTMLIIKLTDKYPLRASIAKWMAAFSFVGIIALYSKSSFINVTEGRLPQLLTGFAILAVVVVIPFVFIFLNNSIAEQNKAETEKAVMEREFKYLEQLSSLAIKVREIKHDYANHLSVMVNLADKGNIDELLHYIESYKDEYGVVDVYAVTGDIAIDSLLSAKFIICKNNDIRLDTSIVKWGKTELTSEEFCSLFGNLLDNAIEGCRTVAKDKRYIIIRTQRVASMLNIYIENSYDENAERAERPGEHGFGLPRIKSVAEKHSGVVTIDYDGHKFAVDILIPLI